MDAIFTGALKNLWRLKTGFWYSRISDAISAALNENPLARAAPPAETLKKSRRFMLWRLYHDEDALATSNRHMRKSLIPIDYSICATRKCLMSTDAAPSLLTLQIDQTGEVAVVRCSGKLVAGVNDILYAKVSQLIPHTKRIVLDLTDL